MPNPDYGSDNEFATLNNCIRSGTVFNRRNGARGAEVQIAYNDRQCVSDWLPVGQKAAAGMQTFACPAVGSEVAVLHYPTGIEQGVVLCSLGTNNSPGFVPNSIDAHAMAGPDGSYFEHEPRTGTTTLAGITHLHIQCGDKLLYVDGQANVKIGGNNNSYTGGNLEKTVGGTTVWKNGGTITVTAPLISLNGVLIDSAGNVTIPGNLIIGGSINIAAGKGGTQMTISGDILHTGNQTTSGVHTDSRGHHS